MGVMTAARLRKLIGLGYGQGHFEHYRAWLRVGTRNTSPVSVRTAGRIPLYRRMFNFFSETEKWMTLLLFWLGATDVREQFPAWPWRHPHPWFDYPRCRWTGDEFAPGLLEIAADAGIEHGTEVGTDLPYIATIDNVATVQVGNALTLVAVGCKPEELIAVEDPLGRVRERLELQHRYADAIGARWLTADRQLFPNAFVANLMSFCPYVETVEALDTDPRFPEFRAIVADGCARSPLKELARRASQRVGWDSDTMTKALHLMLWRQDIDVDITRPILFSRPACPGGRAIRRCLQARIFGLVPQ